MAKLDFSVSSTYWLCFRDGVLSTPKFENNLKNVHHDEWVFDGHTWTLNQLKKYEEKQNHLWLVIIIIIWLNNKKYIPTFPFIYLFIFILVILFFIKF